MAGRAAANRAAPQSQASGWAAPFWAAQKSWGRLYRSMSTIAATRTDLGVVSLDLKSAFAIFDGDRVINSCATVCPPVGHVAHVWLHYDGHHAIAAAEQTEMEAQTGAWIKTARCCFLCSWYRVTILMLWEQRHRPKAAGLVVFTMSERERKRHIARIGWTPVDTNSELARHEVASLTCVGTAPDKTNLMKSQTISKTSPPWTSTRQQQANNSWIASKPSYISTKEASAQVDHSCWY